MRWDVSGTRAGKVVAAAVIASLAVGCASEARREPAAAPKAAEESRSSAGGAEKFEAAANRICDRGEARLDRVRPVATSYQEWPRYGRRVAAAFARTVADLEALSPPEQLAGDYRRWLRLLEATAPDFRAMVEAFSTPAAYGSDPFVDAAYQRSWRSAKDAEQWAQSRLTDLYSCFGIAPWIHVKGRVAAACGGMLFCPEK